MASRTVLKQAGLKTTRPRLKVLSVLENSEVRHMAAEDVYKILLEDKQNIGLGTVYRVLTQLEDAGLVIRNKFEGERAVFELNDESHHDHMVCIACGGVTEFFDRRIEEQQEKVARRHGFVIHDHALTFYGKCKNCAQAGEPGAADSPPKPPLRRPSK
ncbi:MAG: ferric iron uptake transcriptional regulator [Gammaproteobacteria bacterium]|nr:ferric iron uptake transcriptional regulator [Gammaproteobacteria bacterium]MDD9875329.1 ferric iron uptake transcriptional regulator [Gammaproteobacteria bacterium]